MVEAITARVNAAQRLMPSAEVDRAVTALTGVIEQYKFVAAQPPARQNGGEWRKYYVGREVKVRPVIPAALPVGVTAALTSGIC